MKKLLIQSYRFHKVIFLHTKTTFPKRYKWIYFIQLKCYMNVQYFVKKICEETCIAGVKCYLFASDQKRNFYALGGLFLIYGEHILKPIYIYSQLSWGKIFTIFLLKYQPSWVHLSIYLRNFGMKFPHSFEWSSSSINIQDFL